MLADGELFFDQRLPGYQLISAKLTQELNKADSLQITVKPQRTEAEGAIVGTAIVGKAIIGETTAYPDIERFKTTISVLRNGSVISKCRLLDDTLGWNNERECFCEGPLAWLNDTIQRPFSFPVDPEQAQPADYFRFLIERHNEQEPAARQFAIGNITVTDPNNYIARSDTEYSSTWTLLKEGLLDTVGGYIVPRYDGGTIYLDYLSDFDVLANQPVQFGLNLLSLKTERKGEDIVTAILPLGKQDADTEIRLGISSLPDSETDDICKDGDIVYSKVAEELYGSRIIAPIVWDDVTIADNLLNKAVAELAVARQLPSTVSLTAADLAAAGYDFNTFSIGTYVEVVDEWHTDAHGLLPRYLVQKLTIDILNPANNKLTLGATTYSMTASNQKAIAQAMQTVEANATREAARAIRELEVRNTSAIEQSEQSITLMVSENYYTKGETDGLVSSVQTTVEQTAEGIRIDFSNLQRDVDDVAAQADAKFASLQSYIQMAGGSITLGEIGNEVTLKIENDRIGIYVNGVAMTYWTVSDFVAPITLTIPVGGRLILGNFAFIPRTNGSLDFTWVGE